MLGTRDHPTLVDESPAPHYIVVEESPAPQYGVVEESPAPMSGVKDRPCPVVESSQEPTWGRAGTTCPVPMSGTKDQPSLVDDSPTVPKVNNLCQGGRESGGGRFSNPRNKFGLPPPLLHPMWRSPNHGHFAVGGGSVGQGLQRVRSPFLLPLHRSNLLRRFMNHPTISWWKNAHRHPRGPILLILCPLLRRPSGRTRPHTGRTPVGKAQ